LLGSWYDLIFGEGEAGSVWLGQLRSRIIDPAFLRQNFKEIIKAPRFWNGSSLLRKKDDRELAAELRASLEEAVRELADYLYYSDFLQEEAELEAIAAMLLRKYDELRFRDQIFGYDDIAWYTYRYLYDPELSLVEEDSVTNAFYEILTSRVRFLLIDEFQDTSLIQFNILRPLIREVTSGEGVRPYGGVIVVGDEKQSIYGWRGGERDLLRAMQHRLDEREPIRLDTSFRSSPVIIDFVNDFFGGAPLQQRLTALGLDWPYELCKTARLEQPGSLLVAFRTYRDGDESGDLTSQRDASAEMVLKEIVPRLQEGTLRPNETAILARENSSLHAIADILDEQKIDYVLESSHSILEHRAIKPAIHLLRYLATLDFEELLKFFRSDYLLCGGAELKAILLAYRDATADPVPRPLWQKLAGLLPGVAAVQRCAAFLRAAAGKDLLVLCKRIFEDFSVPRIFEQENDSKNIAFFLQIVADFCHNQREYEPSPAGFMRYCEQHEEDEGWQQLGLEEVEAVRLLTIHKAKGLEFDSVFLFWPLANRRDDHGGLTCYVRYDDQFQRIEEHALTYNLESVLAASSAGTLVEREVNRDRIEELNAFYVAVTRARSNLAIYLVGKHKEGLEGLLAAAADAEKPAAAELIITALHEMLAAQGRLRLLGAEAAEARWGEWQRNETAGRRPEGVSAGTLSEYLDPDRSAWYRPDRERFEKEPFLDYRSVYLNKRRVDRGNLVHHYLSFITFDSPDARQRAARRALADYGSLLPAADILVLIDRVEAFIDAHADYFSAATWARVFTEQTLFAPDGREQRIDRMLVSDERREILIIDFKTGESHDQAQLEEYIKSVSSISHVRRTGYTVRGIFLEVEIGQTGG
nr:3'-5' exonuclease [bacterium]